MVTLGVLDQSPVPSGSGPGEAIRQTFELAELADRLGYQRYWLAEHHNTSGLASASPEILIGQVAARTQHLRVGSGGVMLTHYSALKVAEQFRMLETLFPGRIDLGVGRAPGSDGQTAAALAHGPGRLPIDAYPEQLMDLYGFLAGDFPDDHPFRGIKAIPQGATMPELWVLGSSAASAQYAAELGWSFCFAHFINPDHGEQYMRVYRERFQASPMAERPRAALGVSVTCAGSDEEAERLSWSRWVWRILRNHGREGGILSPEEAQAIPLTPPEREYIEHMKAQSIYGSPETVRHKLLALGDRFGVDEFIVVTITHDFAARKRSYELLAEAFELAPHA